MHSFILLPLIGLVGQKNEFIVVYELEDILLQGQFFEQGMLGPCPPYPKVGNVVIVKINNHMSLHSFSIVVVRNISKPRFILDPLEE
jgi:hypothetical protein